MRMPPLSALSFKESPEASAAASRASLAVSLKSERM
jgi:hypothetical protein